MRRLKVMTNENRDRGRGTGRGPDRLDIERAGPRERRSLRVPLLVGATVLAGVGLGLIAVIAGSFLIGLASEAVLAPTLLAKVAGGIAGGGAGMAKGVNDAHKRR